MKNKEIEELLKGMRDVSNPEGCSMNLDRYLVKLLLSHIEQLENLCNKYEQEHKTTFEIWKEDIKKLEQLENNRDKAIELLNKLETQPAYLDCKYYELYGFNEIKNILKGDSDDK